MQKRTLALLALTAALAAADGLAPVSYTTNNGQLGPGGLLYRDDLYSGDGNPRQDNSRLSGGLGQLSDGVQNCSDDPGKDCGSGPGWAWVGWQSDPTITFHFGNRIDFKTVRIYTANWPDAGAHMWKTAIVSFSDDGVTFRDYLIHTTTKADAANHKARYIDIPVNASGRVVRINLVRGAPDAWVVIENVAFEGGISEHQYGPLRPH